MSDLHYTENSNRDGSRLLLFGFDSLDNIIHSHTHITGKVNGITSVLCGKQPIWNLTGVKGCRTWLWDYYTRYKSVVVGAKLENPQVISHLRHSTPRIGVEWFRLSSP